MKKIWLIFALTVIIMAQITFIFSFQSTSARSNVSGTSAVVISKMNYASLRASIHINRIGFASEVTLIFPNGTQQEITGPIHTLEVFLPRSGDFLGDHDVNTAYGAYINYSSLFDGQLLSLSRDHPIDIDIVPNVSDDFLGWYSLQYTDDDEYIDIFWFKIQGDARVHVVEYGVVI